MDELSRTSFPSVSSFSTFPSGFSRISRSSRGTLSKSSESSLSEDLSHSVSSSFLALSIARDFFFPRSRFSLIFRFVRFLLGSGAASKSEQHSRLNARVARDFKRTNETVSLSILASTLLSEGSASFVELLSNVDDDLSPTLGRVNIM